MFVRAVEGEFKVTGKENNGDRILDYLSGTLTEGEERRLERDLLAERHLALLETTPPRAEFRQALERHVAELEAMLGEPRDGGTELPALSLDELQERAFAAETDLLDAYVRGQLGSADRAWIESIARLSQRVRGRLADAEMIRDLPSASPLLQRPWWKIAGIAAAALLTLVTAPSLFHRLTERATVAPVETRPAPPAFHPIDVPMPLRASEIVLRTFPKGTRVLKFSQEIPPGSGTVFEVVLKDPQGQEIHRQTGLRRNRDQGPIEWTASRPGFPEGIYTFEYRGFSENGEPVAGDTVELDLRHQVRPD